MSYEFSSESQRLDLPNPFKIENYFLLITSTIMIGTAIALLILGRDAIEAENGFNSYLPTIIGILMLFGGLSYGGWALTQLRFFFGRNEPKNINIINPLNTDGSSTDMLRETIRQNALTFIEPKGSLNGLLYSKIPDLIFAPYPIQRYAQRQFHNLLAISAVTLSLIICWVSLKDTQSTLWMGVLFFLASILIVGKHIKDRETNESELGIKGLVALIVVAILSPVILPKLTATLPQISLPDLRVQTLTLLVLAIISSLLFFLALIKQMAQPPKTTSAYSQHRFSMNCSPVQLMDETDRLLLENWVDQIPNRQYSRESPEISQGAVNTVGEFNGEVLEETQPMPNELLRKQSLKTTLATPRYRSLFWLDTLGLLISIVGISYIAYFVKSYNILNFDIKDIGTIAFGLSLVTLGAFCFKSAHRLWGRFDFTSKFTWVEMSGNYQSAKMDYGNVISDRIKTEKNIINVENMTLRVWVCEIDSVALNKNEHRYISTMRGLNEEADYLAKHLIQFATNQSIIVAPESEADQQKIMAMSSMNIAQENAIEHSKKDAMNYVATTLKTNCPQCESSLTSDAKFCGNCGAKVN